MYTDLIHKNFKTMARQVIRIGQYPNDGTGHHIRDVYRMINEMTEELYAALGGSVNHWRGDWDAADALPETGGTYTGGLPGGGDEWKLTNGLVKDGKVYAAGTIAKAMINAPGQDLNNWAFIAVQL
jgi:hypothetical protein